MSHSRLEPQRRRLRWPALVGLTGVAFAVAVFVVYLLTSGGFSERTAWAMCQDQVTPKLRSPGTAEFAPLQSTGWTKNVRTYKFPQAWVDSQNGFGATVRTYFDCTVMQEADGSDRAQVQVYLGP